MYPFCSTALRICIKMCRDIVLIVFFIISKCPWVARVNDYQQSYNIVYLSSAAIQFICNEFSEVSCFLGPYFSFAIYVSRQTIAFLAALQNDYIINYFLSTSFFARPFFGIKQTTYYYVLNDDAYTSGGLCVIHNNNVCTSYLYWNIMYLYVIVWTSIDDRTLRADKEHVAVVI